MTMLDSIPETGMHFDMMNLRFEVIDMDGKRVDKVLVTPKQLIESSDVADYLVE